MLLSVVRLDPQNLDATIVLRIYCKVEGCNLSSLSANTNSDKPRDIRGVERLALLLTENLQRVLKSRSIVSNWIPGRQTTNATGPQNRGHWVAYEGQIFPARCQSR
jgi:hypothetical protein